MKGVIEFQDKINKWTNKMTILKGKPTDEKCGQLLRLGDPRRLVGISLLITSVQIV